MWKNKHVVVALLVAPVLSVLAWYAVGNLVGEKPRAAEAGATYRLVARSNCRYASGSCDLHNSDLQISILPGTFAADSVALTMTASHPLQGAALGLVEGGSGQPPSPMTRTDAEGFGWRGVMALPSSPDSTIRVAVNARGATWYAEVPVVFLESDD